MTICPQISYEKAKRGYENIIHFWQHKSTAYAHAYTVKDIDAFKSELFFHPLTSPEIL